MSLASPPGGPVDGGPGALLPVAASRVSWQVRLGLLAERGGPRLRVDCPGGRLGCGRSVSKVCLSALHSSTLGVGTCSPSEWT